MAHESFEDEQVADVLNAGFVTIKVDREERPDIDAVYMDAATALTGHGGWPMTCLLTADGAPFFAGTYFPREQFLRLLDAVSRAWSQDRDGVLAAGQRVVAALAAQALPTLAGPLPAAADLDDAVERLAEHFDADNGGFGAAPKFPPSMVLEFLLRHGERRHGERTADPVGTPNASTMAARTFEAMARGGLYDQVGGGFARYCVDASWVVPHFEKMLYDNAQLLRGYLHWWRRTGVPLAERVARETADFLLRDLRTDDGGFASSLDADTDGVEGLTYVWTPAQLRAVLGEQAPAAAHLLSVTEQGTFEHGASTLQLRQDPDDVAWFAEIRRRLAAARAARPQPGRDDKVVTAWNGLAIGALAEAGVLLGRPDCLRAAVDCAELVLSRHAFEGRLRRTSRAGQAGAALAVAEDYGDLAEGLLVLHQATADRRWLVEAGELLDFALAHFTDGGGGFYDTADDAEALVRRPRDPADGAAPSGSSALAGALLTYAALTGSAAHRAAAEAAVRAVGSLAAAQPRFFGWTLAVAEAFAAGPMQVAVVGEDGLGPLTALGWHRRPSGAVIVSGAPDAPGMPLLADRPLVAEQPAAYACRGFVCDLPVTTEQDLARALRTS